MAKKAPRYRVTQQHANGDTHAFESDHPGRAMTEATIAMQPEDADKTVCMDMDGETIWKQSIDANDGMGDSMKGDGGY